MTSEVKWQNYLNDATEAFLAGESLEAVREDYGVPYQEALELMRLVEEINATMTVVAPSKQFSRNLKTELLGLEQTGMVWRIRHLPARVQVAALAAILSGFLLIVQRFFLAGNQASSETALQEES